MSTLDAKPRIQHRCVILLILVNQIHCDYKAPGDRAGVLYPGGLVPASACDHGLS